MKSKKIITTLVQAGACVICIGAFVVITQIQVKPTTAYKFAKEIPANATVTKADLKKVTIPKDAVSENFVLNEKDIVGKAVQSKAYNDSYVIKNQLIDVKDVDPFEKMDVSNLRKVTIPVEISTGVGGNLKKGDKVDLVYVGKTRNAAGQESVYSKIFLQDVMVYNVIDDGGKQFIDQSEVSKPVIDENGEVVESGEMSVITLALTAEEAEQVSTRLTSGKIIVIGRFEEAQNSSTSGFTVGPSEGVPTVTTNPEQ